MATQNTYPAGYCTYWVKQMASWWPNAAGNAAQWFGYAKSHNMSVGQTPQVGSIAVWDTFSSGQGHVGYVTNVAPNGTFTVSEMNWNGFGVTDNRTVNPQNNPHFLGFIYGPTGTPQPTAIQNAMSTASQSCPVNLMLMLVLFLLLMSLR